MVEGNMKTTSKVAIGLGVAAGGSLLAAWLLTGNRKTKTKDFVSKKAVDLRQAFKKTTKVVDEAESLYV
jgi:hypothetical protein